jgi:hypothetical protein
MPQPRPSTALAGLKVLDLTRVRAGPTCVRVFADFGADVIKVESPPGLDPNENMSGPRLGYDMQNLHRNKRSLALNLKTPEGKAILMKLIDEADLVVENFRPDVKERLGLDAPARNYRDVARADKAAYSRFAHELLKRGVRVLERGAWFVSSEHDAAVVDATLAAVRDAARAVA